MYYCLLCFSSQHLSALVSPYTLISTADALENDDLEYISDDPELGLEDRHLPDEGWHDTDTDGTSDGGGHSGSDYEDIEEEDYTGW